MKTDFKTTERTFLILENDATCDDRTERFVKFVTHYEKGLPVTSGQVDYLFGVENRMDEEIIEAINKADAIVFESTFLNGNQIDKMIRIFSQIKEPKDIISIHSELPYSVPKGCEHHKVYRCPSGYPHEMFIVD